ncbi:MAG: diguanylate cyclase [Deltaproteobacteria bacterium]|nr:diguanylate cyclase [Deltaproteobacteria bacterium]MBN2673308.1 diguanylate cyclase [Deltaproteobacteria bacterium]
MGFLEQAFKKTSDVQRMPTALVISEDKSFLNSVRVNLGKNGFIAIITSNPNEALVLSEDNKLDVIICDYELSQIDGISLFEKIQENKGEDQTPPTLITTDKMAGPLLARCVTAGAAGLQAKSEPIEMIIERVISLLEDTTLRNELEMSVTKRSTEGGTDMLTRIASRKHFSRRFSAESVASYRDRNAISLMMLAVDRYDVLEERHGTQAMESMLANAAKIIEGELRSRDCVGRYSEHTFSIVLPETTLDAAKAVGDRLRRLLNSTEFGSLDDPIQITLSVGISSRPTGVRASPSELITQSLRSCAAAAELGGNKVVADKKLSGQPIALVVGEKGQLQLGIGASLEMSNIEVRYAVTREDAKTILENLPTKLIVLIHTGDDITSLDFLKWARDKYPKAKRIYANPTPSPAQLQVAINKAGIQYYLAENWQQEELGEFIEELIYA